MDDDFKDTLEQFKVQFEAYDANHDKQLDIDVKRRVELCKSRIFAELKRGVFTSLLQYRNKCDIITVRKKVTLMIPKDRVLDKLDLLLKSNDYSGAKRLLEYWLSEAVYTGDGQGVLLMQNELMGLSRKMGEKEQALKYAHDALSQV